MNGSSPRHCRRGSVYVMVLGATMLVMTIGLTALYAARVENRSSTTSNDLVASRLYAQSAIEMGMFLIQEDLNWRDNRTSGWWELDAVIGDGTYSLQVIDPVDGILSNSPTHQIDMQGVGMKGDARHMVHVTLEAVLGTEGQPLDALGTGIHTADGIEVNSSATFTVTGAPASTNDLMFILGTMVGDFEAATSTVGGTHIGLATVPSPAKELPDPALIDLYIAKATQLPFSGNIQNDVLAPGANTYGGGLNAEGLYYIDTGGSDIAILHTRIYGTLVVDAPSKTVSLKSAVLFQTFRADYPVLIVRGNVVLDFTASANGLSETGRVTNFNPAGAPYLGNTDLTMTNTFPSQIDGLVYCTGNLTDQNSSSGVNGAVICGGSATFESDFFIIHDDDLLINPPEGFTQNPAGLLTMKIIRGSWRQVVD